MLSVDQIKKAPKRDYMNDEQLDFFKNMLLEQKQQVTENLGSARLALGTFTRENDELDKAQMEEDSRLQFRIIERETQLLRKIDKSLTRINRKGYGYCEETGEPIGIPRLLVRPTATLSAEAKLLREDSERNFG